MSAKDQIVAASVYTKICLIRLSMKLDWLKFFHIIHYLPAFHVPQHNGSYDRQSDVCSAGMRTSVPSHRSD